MRSTLFIQDEIAQEKNSESVQEEKIATPSIFPATTAKKTHSFFSLFAFISFISATGSGVNSAMNLLITDKKISGWEHYLDGSIVAAAEIGRTYFGIKQNLYSISAAPSLFSLNKTQFIALSFTTLITLLNIATEDILTFYDAKILHWQLWLTLLVILPTSVNICLSEGHEMFIYLEALMRGQENNETNENDFTNVLIGNDVTLEDAITINTPLMNHSQRTPIKKHRASKHALQLARCLTFGGTVSKILLDYVAFKNIFSPNAPLRPELSVIAACMSIVSGSAEYIFNSEFLGEKLDRLRTSQWTLKNSLTFFLAIGMATRFALLNQAINGSNYKTLIESNTFAFARSIIAIYVLLTSDIPLYTAQIHNAIDWLIDLSHTSLTKALATCAPHFQQACHDYAHAWHNSLDNQQPNDLNFHHTADADLSIENLKQKINSIQTDNIETEKDDEEKDSANKKENSMIFLPNSPNRFFHFSKKLPSTETPLLKKKHTFYTQ